MIKKWKCSSAFREGFYCCHKIKIILLKFIFFATNNFYGSYIENLMSKRSVRLIDNNWKH